MAFHNHERPHSALGGSTPALAYGMVGKGIHLNQALKLTQETAPPLGAVVACAAIPLQESP